MLKNIRFNWRALAVLVLGALLLIMTEKPIVDSLALPVVLSPSPLPSQTQSTATASTSTTSQFIRNILFNNITKMNTRNYKIIINSNNNNNNNNINCNNNRKNTIIIDNNGNNSNNNYDNNSNNINNNNDLILNSSSKKMCNEIVATTTVAAVAPGDNNKKIDNLIQIKNIHFMYNKRKRKKNLGLKKFSQNIYLTKNKSGFNLSKNSLYSTQKLIFTETITNLKTNSLINCSSFSDLSSTINKNIAGRTYDFNKNENNHNTPTKGNYESILINKNTKTTSYTSNVLSLLNNTTNLIRSERSIQEARSRDIINNGIKRTLNGDGAIESNKDNIIQYNNSSEITKQKHSVEIMRLNISYISDDISNSSNLDRNERSTFLDIAGPARRIQLYIKNRFIQLMPDGTVNGTQDDMSDYTILQRTTVDVGRIKIQGIATCLYLCMDYCGQVYGSKKFTDDCVFNESMEQHNYNTYSSTFNSNSRRIFYLALNRRGEPRKLMIPPTRPLGKLATYTKSITETVQHERVEHLIAKTFGENRVKHGIRQLCDTGTPLIDLTDKILKTRPTCNASNTINNSSHSSLSVSNDSHSNQKSNIRVNAALNSTYSNSSINNISKNNNIRVNPTKKKKKKRRCRLNEAESELCNRRAHPLKKRPLKGPCKNHSTEEECSKRKTGKKKVNKHINNNNNSNGTRSANGNQRGKKLNGIIVANNERNVRPATNDPLKSTMPIKRSTTHSPTTQSPLLQITTLHFQQFSSSTELMDTVETSKEETTTEDDDEDTEDTSSSLRITNKHIQLVSHDGDFMYNVDLDV